MVVEIAHARNISAVRSCIVERVLVDRHAVNRSNIWSTPKPVNGEISYMNKLFTYSLIIHV